MSEQILTPGAPPSLQVSPRNYETNQVAGDTEHPFASSVFTTLRNPDRERPEKAEPLRVGCEGS
jgi:hypothetical protein